MVRRHAEGMSYAYPPQQAWQPYPMRTTAPISLHVVAIFQYLAGLATLAVGAMLALAAVDVIPQLEYHTGASTFTNRPADVTPIVAVICAVFAFIGLTAIVLGRKVQRGRNWARIVLTALNLLSIAGTLWQGYTLGSSYGETLVALALPALFVLLLNTRAARSWCRYNTY